MSDRAEKGQAAARSWDTYWQGMLGSAGARAGGTREPALDAFWQELLAQELPATGRARRAIDLACGSGAVTGHLAAHAAGVALFAGDYSVSALRSLRQDHPSCAVAALDCAALPFADASFDLVASQFGVEYAGPEAVYEAGRIVAGGGLLALVMHLKDGAIYRDYAMNREAVSVMLDTELLPRVGEAFAAGTALAAGRGDRVGFQQAEQRMAPAVRALEAALQRFPEGVADGLLRQVYQDIAHMYPRMTAYAPADLGSWTEGMGYELEAYTRRLDSMLAAAANEEQLAEFTGTLQAGGFELLRGDTLALSNPPSPAAWVVVMRRAG